MAKAKNETPAVTTYADHEVILPPNKLTKAVAKAALAELANEFPSWMDSECERLLLARSKLGKSARDGSSELFRAAHDIKGEAETFGFPHAGQVADSLCRLLEHAPD